MHDLTPVDPTTQSKDWRKTLRGFAFALLLILTALAGALVYWGLCRVMNVICPVGN